MSFSVARSKYRQAEVAGAPQVESPYKVVQVTLHELEKSLCVLVKSKESERAFPDEHLKRCFTALYILQSSLDFEKGGDLANSLFQVYEFTRIQVLAAFRRDSDCKLNDAYSAIGGIREAWDEIAEKVTDPVSEQ